MAIERAGENQFRVLGPVTVENARSLLEEGARLFADPVSEVDFSGVQEVDSTAVSLMLEWRREASKQNRQVHFLNLPANLRNLAGVYGVLDTVENRRRAPR